MAFVQYMHSNQIGAPQMSGASGSEGQILQVLDACLISGFNPQTAVKAEMVSGQILITFGVTHGYQKLQYITITGADDPNLNGVKRILDITDTTIKLELGAVTTFTGTITTKVAPLGWESMFGSTDSKKRAYRSSNLQGTRTVVYLDANLYGTGYPTNPLKKVRVDLCRDMQTLGTQIDSYTKFENDKYADGLYQFMQSSKGSKNNGTNTNYNNEWILVGNQDFVFFAVDWNTYKNQIGRKVIYYFGDMPRIGQNDIYNFMLGCNIFNTNDGAVTLTNNDTYSNALFGIFNESTVKGFFIKDIAGYENLDYVYMCSNTGFGTDLSGNGGNAYPNPLNYGLSYSDIDVVNKTRKIGRGVLPIIKTIKEDLSIFTKPFYLIGNYLLIKTCSGDASTYLAAYLE